MHQIFRVRVKIVRVTTILVICVRFYWATELSSEAACVRFSNSSQCSAGQICLNEKCEQALKCSVNQDCKMADIYFHRCYSGFCQPFCTATGQCVHGQYCNTQYGQCEHLFLIEGEEQKDVILKPSEDLLCTEVHWSKYYTEDRYRPIAKAMTGDTTYFEEYCVDDPSPCEHSSKLELNVKTGKLTIYELQLNDENDYYYSCNVSDQITKHQLIRLEIYVVPLESSMKITSLPDTVQAGTYLHFTCTVNKIKPPAIDLHWVIAGYRKNGSIILIPNSDGTFTQQNKLSYTFRKEDDGARFECFLFPSKGNEISIHKVVTVLHGPVGKPVIIPSNLSKYENEEVTFTCNTDSLDDRNSRCRIYHWYQIKDGIKKIFDDVNNNNQLKFTMVEQAQGLYQCNCDNEHGSSEYSDAAKLILLDSSSAIVPLQKDMTITGLINPVQADINTKLKCTISRIKPKADHMFWKINEDIVNGSSNTMLNADGNSLTQYNKINHRFHKEDDGSTVQCVLKPVHGKTLTLQSIVNVSYTHGLGLLFTDPDNIGPSIGVTIGIIGAVVLIVLLAVFLIRKYRSRRPVSSVPRTRLSPETQNDVDGEEIGLAEHHYDEIHYDELASNTDDVPENPQHPEVGSSECNDDYLNPIQH